MQGPGPQPGRLAPSPCGPSRVTCLPQSRFLTGTEPARGPWGRAPEPLFTGTARAGQGEGERQRDADQAGVTQSGVGRGVDPHTDTGQGRGEARRAWRWGGTGPVRDPRGLPAPRAGGASPHPHVPLSRLGTAAPGHCLPKRRGPVPVPPSRGWLPRQEEHPTWPRTLPVLKALQGWGAVPVQGQPTTEGQGEARRTALHPVGLGSWEAVSFMASENS